MGKWLLIDLGRQIVGSTSAKSSDGLFRAIHPSTGEDWGLVELKPYSWPRERVRQGELEPLDVERVKKTPR
jgi:hypothetical protein